MTIEIILKALHIIGGIFFVGGTVALGLLASGVTSSKQDIAKLAHGLSRKLTVPSMVLAWVGGLGMFGLGIDVYKRAGWLHGKILLVVIASALAGIIGAKLRKTAAGEEVTGLRKLSIALGVVGVLIVIAVTIGRPLMTPAP